MTDYTTGWQRREYPRNQKRRNPWSVWEHPDTPLIITKSPRGVFHIFSNSECLARDIPTFTLARLTVRRLLPPPANNKF